MSCFKNDTFVLTPANSDELDYEEDNATVKKISPIALEKEKGQDVEEGEILDEGNKYFKKYRCPFFQYGRCNSGDKCQLLHVKDKGLYKMFDSPPHTILPLLKITSPVEQEQDMILTAWDQALEDAKERVKNFDAMHRTKIIVPIKNNNAKLPVKSTKKPRRYKSPDLKVLSHNSSPSGSLCGSPNRKSIDDKNKWHRNIKWNDHSKRSSVLPKKSETISARCRRKHSSTSSSSSKSICSSHRRKRKNYSSPKRCHNNKIHHSKTVPRLSSSLSNPVPIGKSRKGSWRKETKLLSPKRKKYSSPKRSHSFKIPHSKKVHKFTSSSSSPVSIGKSRKESLRKEKELRSPKRKKISPPKRSHSNKMLHNKKVSHLSSRSSSPVSMREPRKENLANKFLHNKKVSHLSTPSSTLVPMREPRKESLIKETELPVPTQQKTISTNIKNKLEQNLKTVQPVKNNSLTKSPEIVKSEKEQSSAITENKVLPSEITKKESNLCTADRQPNIVFRWTPKKIRLPIPMLSCSDMSTSPLSDSSLSDLFNPDKKMERPWRPWAASQPRLSTAGKSRQAVIYGPAIPKECKVTDSSHTKNKVIENNKFQKTLNPLNVKAKAVPKIGQLPNCAGVNEAKNPAIPKQELQKFRTLENDLLKFHGGQKFQASQPTVLKNVKQKQSGVKKVPEKDRVIQRPLDIKKGNTTLIPTKTLSRKEILLKQLEAVNVAIERKRKMLES